MSNDLIEPAAPTSHKKSTRDQRKLSNPDVEAEPTKAKRKKHGANDKGDVDAAAVDKKEKKKKRRFEVEAQAGMDIDVQPEVEQPEKKKKKRERDTEQGQGQPADSSQKEKKKKRKKELRSAEQTEEPSTSLLSTQTLVSSTTPTAAQIESFLTTHSITINTPSTHPALTPVISFSQLDTVIPEKLGSAFTGFKEPTPVQACTWPPALNGQDVVGIAETGSGKTLAFGIPALAKLLESFDPNSNLQSKKPRISTVTVLVVAPTRELALQTHDTLSALGAPFGIASVAVFGGVDKRPQVKSLANANKDGKVTRIVVGTPGRILDLVNDGACDLSQVNYLVLDEADRMLDKGFENDIKKIILHTRPQPERQTMMFSATWPEAVRRLASTFQRDPVRVTVGSDDLTANRRVEQSVEVFDDARSKDTRLLDLLRSLSHKKTTDTGSEEARILIFALYKKETSRVEGMLRRQGYAVGALHGDMSQPARMEALDRFKNGTTGLLVATDVAARGLDIPNVGAVINYTFPLTIEDYIHRIGRTGRGGRTGKSITFFTGDAHERSLAGELAQVCGSAAAESLRNKFPMTIKKKTHSVYGAFFRDDIPTPTGPTKIKF